VVDEVRAGTPPEDVARAFGVSVPTALRWTTVFEQGGDPALQPKPRAKRLPQPAPAPIVEAVVTERTKHPHHGTRRIQHVLARFEALGVSEHLVRRILHEEGLLAAAAPIHERPAPVPTRFERAQPNQMWQSDIFSLLLRRHARNYLTGFHDDCSRFVVSHAIAHQQRGDLVLEALDRGIAAFGPPDEILTDQGRQYTAWRGETVFEQELRRLGIRHIMSRPHHPQTLGKIERFWKTLWDEFLSRTVFADYGDCERRLALFVHAYNFERRCAGRGLRRGGGRWRRGSRVTRRNRRCRWS
jgi:transposase InsO family protein